MSEGGELSPTAKRANDVKVSNLQFLCEFCHFSHFNDKRQTNMTFFNDQVRQK